jgi:hypothetical protein
MSVRIIRNLLPERERHNAAPGTLPHYAVVRAPDPTLGVVSRNNQDR